MDGRLQFSNNKGLAFVVEDLAISGPGDSGAGIEVAAAFVGE